MKCMFDTNKLYVQLNLFCLTIIYNSLLKVLALWTLRYTSIYNNKNICNNKNTKYLQIQILRSDLTDFLKF